MAFLLILLLVVALALVEAVRIVRGDGYGDPRNIPPHEPLDRTEPPLWA